MIEWGTSDAIRKRVQPATMTQPNLSAHVYHSNLNLAHTTADFVGSDEIQSAHLAAA